MYYDDSPAGWCHITSPKLQVTSCVSSLQWFDSIRTIGGPVTGSEELKVLSIPVISHIQVWIILGTFTCTQRNLVIHIPVCMINASIPFSGDARHVVMMFTGYSTKQSKLKPKKNETTVASGSLRRAKCQVCGAVTKKTNYVSLSPPEVRHSCCRHHVCFTDTSLR